MTGHIEKFLVMNPSTLSGGGIRVRQRGSEAVPDNTWRFERYEPEVDRYGGPAALLIAEEHFGASTIVALDILARSKQAADPESAKLRYALQLAAILVLSAGFRAEVAYRFLEECLKYVFFEEYYLDDYTDVWRRCREDLVDCLTKLSAIEVDWALGGDSLVSRWGGVSAALFSSVQRELGVSPSAWYHARKGPQKVKRLYGRIVHSQLHMLLNRLGFWGRREERILRLLKDGWHDVVLG